MAAPPKVSVPYANHKIVLHPALRVVFGQRPKILPHSIPARPSTESWLSEFAIKIAIEIIRDSEPEKTVDPARSLIPSSFPDQSVVCDLYHPDPKGPAPSTRALVADPQPPGITPAASAAPGSGTIPYATLSPCSLFLFLSMVRSRDPGAARKWREKRVISSEKEEYRPGAVASIKRIT